MNPIADHCVEGVLVLDVDLAPPVEDHVLLCLQVKHVDSLGVGSQPQLPHLQPPPPGPHLRDVELDLLESRDKVGGDGEQDRVERNLTTPPAVPPLLPSGPESLVTCTTCPGHV